MVKPEQVLIIEPQSELRFRGPFTGTAVTSYMQLTNPTNHKIYFKIKTTAPKRYCVRPNSGVLKPNGFLKIAVILQPLDFDPTEKNKHKFMVQAVIAPDDDEDYTDVWRETKPETVMESKLKCVFENPVTNTTITKTTSNTTTTISGVNSDIEKTKEVSDIVKSLPKVLGETDEKLIKAAQEVSQLRVEESTLRQENLQLKEDLLKLKNAALGTDAFLATARGLTSQSSSNRMSPKPTLIVIAVAMVIVGYLLGKMF